MPRITFIRADGSELVVDAPAGARLLEVAQRHGMPLEGACEGVMACSTCHVIVAPGDFERLPRASDDEEDMLDLAYGLSATSRLSCQIVLDASLEGLTVRIPAGANNALLR